MNQEWFAVRTRSRTEKVVRDELLTHHIEPFLPTITRWSRWKDRRKAVDWPLFPGYCFARFERREAPAVTRCHGVAGIVTFGDQLAPVADREIENLQTLIATTLKFDPAPFLETGSLVEVTHGPLKGVVGRLMRKSRHARLVLAVTLIGQGVSVEVDAADVRKS